MSESATESATEILEVLQQAMAMSNYRVFWIGALLSAPALLVILFLPNRTEESSIHRTDDNAGEKMFIAEQTTINAGNQPNSNSSDG